MLNLLNLEEKHEYKVKPKKEHSHKVAIGVF